MNLIDFLPFLGGLSFFLFGMDIMSENLERLAGSRFEERLKQLTANPLRGFLLGVLITLAIQSSSAVTVMLVGLVNSGIMTFGQSVTLIFGTNVGTTITAWIFGLSGISSDAIWLQMLKPAHFSPVLAFIGILLRVISKKEKSKTLGMVFIGFAVLIFGMNLMSDTVKPLSDSELFPEILSKLNSPLLGLLFGIVTTAILQSSSASVGILQAFSLTGSMTMGFVIPIIMGQNIGTCITSILSSIGTSTQAKRVSIMHLLVNVLGTAMWFPLYLIVDAFLAPAILQSNATAFHIAVSHTLFNLANTAILLPIRNLLVRCVEKWLPSTPSIADTESIVFLDERLYHTPSAALTACTTAASRMAELSCSSVDMALCLLSSLRSVPEKKVKYTAEAIRNTEKETDIFEDRLGNYLVTVAAQSHSEHDSQTVTKLLRVIGDFERLGDHAEKLADAAEEIKEKGLRLSDEVAGELDNIMTALTEILTLTQTAYCNDDAVIAREVEPLEQVIDSLVAQSRLNHITRLKEGRCSFEAGFVLSDILQQFERISDHCSNIAIAIIETKNKSFQAHRYLHDLQLSDPLFRHRVNAYTKKYNKQ